jgi:hypothetical protein
MSSTKSDKENQRDLYKKVQQRKSNVKWRNKRRAAKQIENESKDKLSTNSEKPNDSFCTGNRKKIPRLNHSILLSRDTNSNLEKRHIEYQKY